MMNSRLSPRYTNYQVKPSGAVDKDAEQRARDIYARVIDQGGSHNLGIAALANSNLETGGTFDPTMKQTNGPGRGIFQLEKPRYETDPTNLVKFSKDKGLKPEDLNIQVDFMIHELKNVLKSKDKSPLYDAIANAETPEEATKLFHYNYEKDESSALFPGDLAKNNPNLKNRIQHASYWDKLLKQPENPVDQAPNPEATLQGTIENSLPNSLQQSEPLANPPLMTDDQTLVQNMQRFLGGGANATQPMQLPEAQQPAMQPTQPMPEPTQPMQQTEAPRAEDGWEEVPQQQSGWEEVPQEQFDAARKNYMGSRESFFSNLGQSAKQRVKNIATLGTAEQEPQETPGSFGGQAGQLLGHALVDAPAMVGAGALGPAGIPALLGYGYATSPGESSSDKMLDALMTGAPIKLGRAKPGGRAPGGRAFEGGSGGSFSGDGGFPSFDELSSMFKRPTSDGLDAAKAAHEAEQQRTATVKARAPKSTPEGLRAQGEDLDVQLMEAKNELAKAKESDPFPVNPATSLPDLRHETVLNNAEQIHKDAQQHQSDILAAQKESLGDGQNIPERAATEVNKFVEGEKSAIKPLYDGVTQALDGQNVQVPNVERAQAIRAEVNRLIDEGIIAPEGDNIYDSIVNQLYEEWPGPEVIDIPASKFVKIWKSMRDLAYIARNRSREPGIPQDERMRWESRAKQLEPIAKQQRDLLQDSIPPDVFGNLMSADKQWKERVIPFYRNPVYLSVRNNGFAPDNIIKATRGIEDYNQVMQRAIQATPELNRLALNEVFANKPETMATAGEMFQPYIDAHAPSQRFVRDHAKSKERVNNAADTVNRAREHAEQVRDAREVTDKQAKDSFEQQQEIKKKIDKLISQLEENKRHLRDMRKQIKREGITKENVMREQALVDKDKKLKTALWNIAKTISSVKFGSKLIKILSTIVDK